jgi:hypothetical protein
MENFLQRFYTLQLATFENYISDFTFQIELEILTFQEVFETFIYFFILKEEKKKWNYTKED